MKRRILLVEDVRDFREAFAFALESRGYFVTQAGDGMEALAEAKACTPDAVVLDIGLPRLDGFYVAEQWKRDRVMKTVPVIALSAFNDDRYEERAMKAGCSAALRKPASPDEIIHELERLLG